MKIGYPCINRSIGCTANSTFRLASYSENRLIETVTANIACLKKILTYNVEHGLLFFRISSDIIPFASHPVCAFDWADYFGRPLRALGTYIRANDIRIGMHPDQFVLINALRDDIVSRSIGELAWHCRLLDAMELADRAKVQIHIGGAYSDKAAAIERFITRYRQLPSRIRARLVVENDDRLFSLRDCLRVHEKTGIPVVFDSLHHRCLNNGEHEAEAVRLAAATWGRRDGPPIIDYSSQAPGERRGKHVEHIDIDDFIRFTRSLGAFDGDIMLEIKDKEASAREAADAVLKPGHAAR